MSEGLTRKEALAVGAAGAAVGVGIAAGVGIAFKRRRPAEFSGEIAAGYRREGVPLDPGDDAWGDAQPTLVALLPQQMAPPFLADARVSELEARALHDGRELAFRLEWEDGERDDLDGIARFHDAVAVQLPARAGAAPPVAMGAPGAPVHICQWRASWQRDLSGRANERTIYPRVVHDVMPGDLLDSRSAVAYTPGRAVGNPLSDDKRTSSVEELVAEGFGTATTLPAQRARGDARWSDGRWRVVIALPLHREDAGEPLAPGSTWPVAFAVWLGSEANRGGRKQYANWLSCTLEAAE